MKTLKEIEAEITELHKKASESKPLYVLFKSEETTPDRDSVIAYTTLAQALTKHAEYRSLKYKIGVWTFSHEHEAS